MASGYARDDTHRVMPEMISCHAREDMLSYCARHRVVQQWSSCRLGSFGWSLPIMQFNVCVGQSGRIQLINVAHIGGLV